MAAEAAKASPSSSLTTASPSSVANCWTPFLDLAHMSHMYNCYPQHFYYVLAQEAAIQQAASASNYEQRPHKRRKVEGTSNSGHQLPQESTTHLWSDRRRSINFKPYSGLESVPNHPRQSQLPLKRRNDGLPAGLPNYTKGSVGSSRTHVIQPDRGCTIGNLFPEILSMIFEYLDTQSKGRVAQVSKRWRDAAYKKSVWKGLTATLHVDRSNPHLPNLKDLTPSLVSRGIKHVQILSLGRSSPKELIKGIPNLESLNLSGCFNLSDHTFEGAISKEVPSLTSLNLSNCKDISNSSLVTIAIRCKNLETIDLSGCTKITNDGLANLASLPKLKHLNLRSCRQISDPGIGHLSGASLSSASEVSSQPPPAASSLESLSLQDCQKLSDESLRYISQGLRNLKRINLSFCVSITDTGLKSLAKVASLEEINLRSCDNVSDIGIGFLAEEHQRLAKLDVSFCSNVTDASLRHMAGSGLAASLHSLALTTCAITDDGLIKLAKKLSKLRELQTGQCVNISDLSLEAIGQNMKELTLIDLYGCLRLSEAALKKLRTQLPKLTKLNLSL